MNEMCYMILAMFAVVIIGQLVSQGIWLLVTTKLLDSRWFVKKCVKMSFMVYEEVINGAEEIMNLTRDLEERLRKLEGTND